MDKVARYTAAVPHQGVPGQMTWQKYIHLGSQKDTESRKVQNWTVLFHLPNRVSLFRILLKYVFNNLQTKCIFSTLWQSLCELCEVHFMSTYRHAVCLLHCIYLPANTLL